MLLETNPWLLLLTVGLTLNRVNPTAFQGSKCVRGELKRKKYQVRARYQVRANTLLAYLRPSNAGSAHAARDQPVAALADRLHLSASLI